MSTKAERLRRGEAVEFEKGVFGRLNPSNKTIELSTGEVLPASRDTELFPETPEQAKLFSEKERIRSEIEGIPGGKFFYQASQIGLPSAAQDWAEKLTLSADDYLRSKQARGQISQEISQSNPVQSFAGKVAGLTPDLILTQGMSGKAAGALLPALHAGPRIAEEPLQVAGEAAIGGALGSVIDKGANFLNQVSQRRALNRTIPGQAAEVRAQNLATKTEEAQRFNNLRSQVQRENEAQRHQYQLELNARRNRMIEAQNAKTAAKNENARLNQDYQTAKREYETALKEQPRLQKEAQKQYSNEVVKQAEKVSRAFPKNSKIPTSEFNVEGFIESNINQAGIKGTPDANRFTRIVKGIFPDGEQITPAQFAEKYVAIERGLQEATPQTRQLFNQFKEYVGNRLPTLLADELAFHRIIPTLKSSLMRDAKAAVEKLNLPKSGLGSEAYTIKKIELSLDDLLSREKMPNFLEKLQSGEFARELKEKWITPDTFQFHFLSPAEQKTLKSAQATTSYEKLRSLGLPIIDPSTQRYEAVMQSLGSKIESQLAKADLKSIALDADAAKRLGTSVNRTLGEAAPLPFPQAPIAPSPVSVIPEPIEPLPPPPLAASLPQRAPTPALPEPTLPPAQGLAERAGDLLEKPILQGKSGLGKLGPIGQLAGLKFLLGKGAVPAEAAYLGLKGLTAPGAEGIREALRQGSVEAIVQLAQKYPSYRDGIIENPQERRSFNKELEESPLPLSEKAIYQSKVNRGIALWNSLS